MLAPAKFKPAGEVAYLAIINSKIDVMQCMVGRAVDNLLKGMPSNHVRIMNLIFMIRKVH